MCFQGSRCTGRYGGLPRGSTAAALHPEPCHACRAPCSHGHLWATPSVTGTPPGPCVEPFPWQSPFPGHLCGLFSWHWHSNYFPGMPTFTCREEAPCASFSKAELSSSACLSPPKLHPAPCLAPLCHPPPAQEGAHRARMGVLVAVRGCSWGSSSV